MHVICDTNILRWEHRVEDFEKWKASGELEHSKEALKKKKVLDPVLRTGWRVRLVLPKN